MRRPRAHLWTAGPWSGGVHIGRRTGSTSAGVRRSDSDSYSPAPGADSPRPPAATPPLTPRRLSVRSRPWPRGRLAWAPAPGDTRTGGPRRPQCSARSTVRRRDAGPQPVRLSPRQGQPRGLGSSYRETDTGDVPPTRFKRFTTKTPAWPGDTYRSLTHRATGVASPCKKDSMMGEKNPTLTSCPYSLRWLPSINMGWPSKFSFR